MDPRQEQLQRWVIDRLAPIVSADAVEPVSLRQSVVDSWQTVAGDASSRRYFRLGYSQQTYIAMDAPPEHEDVAEFARIAELMRSSDLRSPLIYGADFENGFLLLEDFGNDIARQYLQPANGQRLFDLLLPVLKKLAQCKTEGLPDYTVEKLTAELELFPDWYLAHYCGYTFTAEQHQVWRQLCDQLSASALAQPQVFVHRDFHSCNLHMLTPVLEADTEVGVIDFQDAVVGPASYDLVSWLWDRYIHWPRADLERWMAQAAPLLAPDTPLALWQRQCDLMGLQRNLKIVGIFSRLGYRDGKKSYIGMIPQFIRYIEDAVISVEDLSFARPLFENLPGFDLKNEDRYGNVISGRKGERMRPLTDTVPKPLLTVAGKSLLQRLVEQLADAGITRIIVNHAYLGEQIVAAVEQCRKMVPVIEFLLSPEPPGGLETAGGILAAMPLLDRPNFLVANADIWTNYDFSQLLTHRLNGNMGHLVMVETPSYKTGHDFFVDASSYLSADAEFGDGYTFAGISLLSREFVEEFIMPACVAANVEPNQFRYALREPLLVAMGRRKLTADRYAGDWRDIGTVERLELLRQHMGGI